MDCSRAHIYLWRYLQGRHQPERRRTVHCAEESLECLNLTFLSDGSARRFARQSVRAHRQCRIPARNRAFYAE